MIQRPVGGTQRAGAADAEDSIRGALLAQARRINPLGLNQGASGNLSCRWRRSGADGFLITPSALPYDETTVDDLVWMRLDPSPAPGLRQDPGSVDATVEDLADGTRSPSSEWRLHRDVYRARPDAGAVIHVHAVHATTLACLPRIQRDGIPSFHYMIAVAGGDSIRCAPYATFGTQALSDHVVAALDGRLACLMANHGLVAVGADLQAALAVAVEVETLARMYGQALLIGEPVVLDAIEMRRVLDRFADYRRQVGASAADASPPQAPAGNATPCR